MFLKEKEDSLRGFVIDQPGVSHIAEDLAYPEMGPEDVLVRIRRVGFCGTDLNTYRGKNPLVEYPRIPGHEISAEIVEIGAHVPDGFSRGHRVSVLPYSTCGVCWSCLHDRPNACRNNETLGVQRDGGMTEYLSVPYTKLIGNLGDLSFDDITIVEPLAVGFHAARRAEPGKGDTLLVFGCGMVGLGAIANGALLGAEVIAVDIEDGKLDLAKKSGALHTINSAKENLAQRVEELTGAHGPNIVIEAIGLPATYQAAVDLVSFSGRVVYVGYAKQPIAFETKKFVMKEIQIRGARNAVKQDFADVLSVLKDHKLPVKELITEVVPLSEAGRSLSGWDEDPGKVSKIIVSMD